jgi:hypothetical protein
LAEHGFNVGALPFYSAAVRVALRATLEKVPRLTMFGIGVGPPGRKPDGTWQTSDEVRATFVAERERLLSDYEVEPFLLSLAYLSRVKPTKTIRQGTSSYSLKHAAERFACTYPEGGKLGPQYVSNGVLIAAAVHAGFKMRTYVDNSGYDSLNVSFNMSRPSIRSTTRDGRMAA